jgi:hypothetical protein
LKSFDLLRRGSHVFVVYYSREIELNDFHSFIKKGLDHNELVIVFLENYSKDKFHSALNQSAKFFIDKNFKKKDCILIKPTETWYNQDEFLNVEVFLKKWEILVTSAIQSGKEGIRIFVETNKFLRERLENALISYDKILEDLFDFPITSLYVYKKKDLEAMTPQQIAILTSNHGYHLNELLA